MGTKEEEKRTIDDVIFAEVWKFIRKDDLAVAASTLGCDLGALGLYQIISFYHKCKEYRSVRNQSGFWEIVFNYEEALAARRIKNAVKKHWAQLGHKEQPEWASTFQNKKHQRPQSDRLDLRYAKRR